ncbi:mammalian cell entry protein [Mycolicibacterium hippocampi]|uniref:Mammalian cell entry protein n=1 Tax=Mycolicibacterium hippocampi TaxID=659824 RepID=A0A7I9ZM31_9MYCO|nr:mammalian cell entry protein [Mycolicibacterium hippocampi]GFH02081.1 hypothetical protein MHIP_25640 [Mycolicibacterium hippocampi]
MDDQQPESDDLTDTHGKSLVTEDTAVEDDGCAQHPEPQRRLDRIGGWPGAAVAVATVFFLASVAFAGAALQPYLADRADAANRLDVAHTAAEAVTTLWTYTPDTIDQLADRTDEFLTGDFRTEYRKFLDSVVLPNKRAQITDTTDVVGVSVESLTGSDAVALVFTNTSATSPMTQNVPALKYIAYRLEMKRENSSWRVNTMTTVSFIDMTPQL